MSRRALTTYLSAAVLALGTAPLAAQENPKNDQGQRPNPSGSSQGSAVSRPAGGSGGGGSSTSSGSGGDRPSSGSSSSAGRSHVNPSGGGFSTDFAPARPERRAEPRDNSGQRPNPNTAGRDNSSRSGPATERNDDEQRRVAPGSSSSALGGDASGDRRRAVPAYSRPRDGRPVVGSAVERRGRPPVAGGAGSSSYYYDPYYRYNNYYNRYPYGYYYAGYGLGLGYFYDPAMWGYYSPYGYGGGSYSGGGGGYSRESYREVGGLRLKVKPLQGQVYVDGYYVGEVDSFDGVFQKLQIEAGAHRVEIRADGFETFQFEVMVTRGETVTYKGEMKRIQ